MRSHPSAHRNIHRFVMRSEGSRRDATSLPRCLMRASAKQRGTPENGLPTEARPGVAYIRIKPKKYISWDYSRED